MCQGISVLILNTIRYSRNALHICIYIYIYILQFGMCFSMTAALQHRLVVPERRKAADKGHFVQYCSLVSGEISTFDRILQMPTVLSLFMR